MQRNLQWDDFHLVLAVGRGGSLSGAARVLRVNHSTVFRRLRAIEEKLGVRLFERRREGYVATTAGEEALRVAESAAGLFEDGERRLAGRDLRPTGAIRIATTDTLLISVLTGHLARFRQAHPEIELVLVVSNEISNLSRRDAEVAVRPAANPPANLVGRRISSIASAIYGAPGILGSAAMPDDLSSQDWIAPEDSLSHLPAARWLASTYPRARIAYRANTLVGMMEAAKSGVGVVALPCFLGDREDRLLRLSPVLPALDSELWVLTHEDLRRVGRIRTFTAFVASALGTQRSLFEGAGASPTDGDPDRP